MRMQNMQLFIHSYYPVWAMSKEVGDYSIHNPKSNARTAFGLRAHPSLNLQIYHLHLVEYSVPARLKSLLTY